MTEISGDTHPEFDDEENTARVYLKDLGLSWEQLSGKSILDLGSGLAKFAQAAKRRGVSVVSLDAHPEWSKGDIPRDVPFVIGDGRQLPFNDNSFDLIVARASVHSIIDNEAELRVVINEAKRVLKDGGEFRFGPGHFGHKVMEQSRTDKILERLDRFRFDSPLTEWRIRRMEQSSLKMIQKIDPLVTKQVVIQGMESKGKQVKSRSSYYTIKKSADQ